MTGSLWHLALAVGLFVGSHFLLSSPPIRRPLAGRLGERPFVAAYSTLALLLFVWVLRAYGDAPLVDVWEPGTGLRHLALAVMPFACVLVVAGLTTRNPTTVGADTRAIAARGPAGIFTVTRHPMMWGFSLWGVAHLLANGDAAGILLFGGMTVLAAAGALAIDAKKRATLGDSWAAYEAGTSFVPLAAAVGGRARVSLAEIGWWRLALGFALYALLLWGHGSLFGVAVWPL
jgi:uncharacterized membrane protein